MIVSLGISWARGCEDPYRHIWIPRLFPCSENDRILHWLEQDLPWQYTRTNFYQQFEFSLKDVDLPSDLEFLTSAETIGSIGSWLHENFQSPALELDDIVAHLLESGHGIGVHNDHRPNGETHRLLVQFSRGVEGGVTALCRDQSAESVRRLIKPIHGTAIAFAISDSSYHAVSKVLQGRRFTLVYSFKPVR